MLCPVRVPHRFRPCAASTPMATPPAHPVASISWANRGWGGTARPFWSGTGPWRALLGQGFDALTAILGTLAACWLHRGRDSVETAFFGSDLGTGIREHDLTWGSGQTTPRATGRAFPGGACRTCWCCPGWSGPGLGFMASQSCHGWQMVHNYNKPERPSGSRGKRLNGGSLASL